MVTIIIARKMGDIYRMNRMIRIQKSKMKND